jgi:alanine dehydrogenase
MKREGTLVLKRSDVATLLSIDDCIAAVEQAFRLHAEGKTSPPGVLGIHARTGGFHIKAGLLNLNRSYFAAKANANFPENARLFGLPLIQGLIVVFDAENGYPLAVMDSMEITIIRTGAATAVAAKYLARPDSTVATICGCGNQGRISLRAMTTVLPLKQVYAFDKEPTLAETFANELSKEVGIEIRATNDLAWAARHSDVCVTCTPSKEFLLNREYIKPGTFVGAVGADNEEKQELDPRLLQASKVVVDLLEQCATIGDLHHALEQGLMTREEVHAELGEVIAGKKPGRTSDDEIIVFDSTGTALQDVTSAAIVYERAIASGTGVRVDFGQ